MTAFLTWRNLADNPVRTLVAVAGVCFAVALLFMQLGFRAGVGRTANLVLGRLDFDIVLTSPNYVMLTQAQTFPRRRLYQASANPDVANVMPLYVSRQNWRNAKARYFRSVVVIGIRPSDEKVILNRELDAKRPLLALDDTMLVDSLTRSDVGPRHVGLVTQVGPLNLKVVGEFTIGPGFETGMIVVSDKTFSRLYGGWPLDQVHLGLVNVREGADPQKVAKKLREYLPADVRVLTRDEIEEEEEDYWVTNTSTGIIFGSGVIVALLFGIVIIYQVLSLEVNSRLPEYATLKAMGFSDAYLALVVLQQAVFMAVLSYIPGFLIALGIYATARAVTHLPITMTVWRAVGVFIATLLMCSFSGLMAIRFLRKADPVDLF
ncbi:MAG: ABC transporter permease DevC [Isosphaeraceae bacterium]